MNEVVGYLSLTKADEEKRLIYGRATQQVVDRSGEELDYASAVPAFREWSQSFEKSTGGLSKGNLRVQHDPKKVAGKFVDIIYNDADRAIDVVAKVVDDNEWRKVLEGCYTGFSIGGGYARRWEENGIKKYTPRISEISLVDRPCVPTAGFMEILKADGSVERREFTHTEAERQETIAALADGVMPGSPEATMPVLEQVADTGGIQPQPVGVGAVEKVEPVLFGDLWKSARGTDGDGDGVLNEGRKRKGPGAAEVGAEMAVGAVLGASLMPKEAVAHVARRGLDAAQGAALGFATRNDIRSHATPRLGDGPMAKPGWRTTLDRILGGAKAGLKAGRAMDGAAQKTLDEGVAVAWRRQGGMAANVRPGDAQKLKAALAARDFLTRRTGKLRLGAGIAGAVLGAGAAYGMSKADEKPSPLLFADLYKADGRAGRDADGDGKYNEKEGGSSTRTVGAAVGGALAGAALTAAALRTSRGQAAIAAARSASGPLTAAAQRAVKDIGGAAKVISNSAAGKYAGEQYASFRSMPKLAQLAIGGTALAVTPGGDKLLGLVGLDPNAEWVPGGFRFDLKSKSTGTTVFSQSVRPFADGGVPATPYTPPQQQYQQPQQAQRPAQTYQSTNSIMGQPARPPAATPPAQVTSQPPARDAGSAYAASSQVNGNNPHYREIKQKLDYSTSKGLFEGDRHESLPHDIIVSASRAMKDSKINAAERNDVVFRTMQNERTASGKKRFDLSTPESAYTSLTEHLADQHDAEIYKENEDYRRADRARINAIPGLSQHHRKELHSYLDNVSSPPLPFGHKELNKALLFDDLYKSWIEPDQPTPIMFADLWKSDGRAGRDGDGDGKLHEGGDGRGGGGSFHDGRGYSVAAKNRAHEKALKAGKPDTKEYADSYHKALIAEDPKYRAENTQVIEERRGRDVWPIMAAKATSWAAFGAGAALGAALPNKRVGQATGAALGGLYGAAKGAVKGSIANPTKSFRVAGRTIKVGGKDWVSRLAAGAVGSVTGAADGVVRGAKATTRSKGWNRAANAALAANAVGWGVYFGVQPPVRFLGEVNDAVRGGARRVEKADV